MELPVLDKFCFIFHLKTGCIVLGCMNSLLTFLLGLILITLAVDVKAGATAQAKREDAEAGMSSVVYGMVILLVILLFIKFLLDMILVWAVCKTKSVIIKNYCIFWIVFLVLFIISFLKTMFHMGAGLVISLMLFLAQNVYYICVIRSFMISINEDSIL